MLNSQTILYVGSICIQVHKIKANKFTTHIISPISMLLSLFKHNTKCSQFHLLVFSNKSVSKWCNSGAETESPNYCLAAWKRPLMPIISSHYLSFMNKQHYITLKRIQEILILVLISGAKTCTSLNNKCDSLRICSLCNR